MVTCEVAIIGLSGSVAARVSAGQGVDDMTGCVEFTSGGLTQQRCCLLTTPGLAPAPAQEDEPHLPGDAGDLSSLFAGASMRVEHADALQISEAQRHQSLVLPPDAK